MNSASQAVPEAIDVSVIVVNWNSKDYLRECLNSLERHCRWTTREVIVVDGASFDGCGEMLAREFPTVLFIQSQKNVGFAKANNIGAAQARGKTLFLLNPDTYFGEDSIQVMLRCLNETPGAGAVGCRLLNSDGSLQTSCIQSLPTAVNQALDSEFLRRLFPNSYLWGVAALHARPPEVREVEAISGAAILIKRNVFEQVGGFTETYFMYGEDMDLCFKVRQAGFKNYYTPHTNITHHGGGSSQTAPSHFSVVMMRESVRLFLVTSHGKFAGAAYRLAMFLSALSRLAVLYLLLPLAALRRRHVQSLAAISKWLAVLKWSLNRRRALRRHLAIS